MVTLVIKRIGFMIITMIIVSMILFLFWKPDLPAIRPSGSWASFPTKNNGNYGVSSTATINPSRYDM